MSINEEAATQDYLIGYLGADLALGGMVNSVWLSQVPQTVPMPVVKIDRQEASDVRTVGLYRVMDSLAFLIRGVVHWKGGSDPVDYSEVNAIADRLDTLLHRHEDTTSLLELAIYREETWTTETVEGGDLFLHAGGIYRVLAHAV